MEICVLQCANSIPAYWWIAKKELGSFVNTPDTHPDMDSSLKIWSFLLKDLEESIAFFWAGSLNSVGLLWVNCSFT